MSILVLEAELLLPKILSLQGQLKYANLVLLSKFAHLGVRVFLEDDNSQKYTWVED